MPESDEKVGIGFSGYVRILQRNWALITGCIVVAMGATGAYSLVAPPMYESATRLYVSVRSTAEDGRTSELTQGGTYARQAVLSYVDVIQSASVLNGVIEELDLDMDKQGLLKVVSVSSPRESVLIDVSVTGTDAEETAAIANSVADNFIEVVTDVLEKPRGGGESPVQISTIEEAVVPAEPYGPNLPLNLTLGFVLGLAVGLGLAALRAALDTRLRSANDLRQITELPTLGAIPDDPKASKHRLIVQTDPRSPRAEAFRSLRTNLRFVNVDGNPRTFVITGAAPGEGKTTVATNLAISLAQMGESVVLVDADLRKPTVAKVMGVDGEVGLSNLLVGMVEIEDVLHRWGPDHLYVLPAGRIPPNPSELLGSSEMKDLLTRLSSEFSYVIIDSPPTLAVTDSAVLSRIAGGTVLVAALGVARKPELSSSIEALEGIARRISGVVLMRVPVKGIESHRYARYEYLPEGALSAPSEPAPLAWLDDEDLSKLPRRHVRR